MLAQKIAEKLKKEGGKCRNIRKLAVLGTGMDFEGGDREGRG